MRKLTLNFLMLTLVGVSLTGVSWAMAKSPENTAVQSSELDRELLEAVKDENLSKFESLLEKGANPNEIYGKQSKDWVMCEVTRQGRLEFLKLALQHGGDINLRNPLMSKSTVKSIFSAPLLCAIRHHNDEAFDYLLQEGVDIDIVSCTECKHERHRGSAVTVAEAGNEYRMAMELINRRNGQLGSNEIRSLIHGLEKTTIDESSGENFYRLQMVDWLRSQGHEVTPWTSSKKK